MKKSFNSIDETRSAKVRKLMMKKIGLFLCLFCVIATSGFAQDFPGNIVECPDNISFVSIDFKGLKYSSGNAFRGHKNLIIFLDEDEVDKELITWENDKCTFKMKNGSYTLKFKEKGDSGWWHEYIFSGRNQHIDFTCTGALFPSELVFRQKSKTALNEAYYKKMAKGRSLLKITTDLQSKPTLYVDDTRICNLKKGSSYFWIDRGPYVLKIDKSDRLELEDYSARYIELEYPSKIIGIVKNSSL